MIAGEFNSDEKKCQRNVQLIRVSFRKEIHTTYKIGTLNKSLDLKDTKKKSQLLCFEKSNRLWDNAIYGFPFKDGH